MQFRQTANKIGTTFALVCLVGAGFGWALGGSAAEHLISGAETAALFAGIPILFAQATAAAVRHWRRRALPGLPIVIAPHRVH
jgi:hypothetical protein